MGDSSYRESRDLAHRIAICLEGQPSDACVGAIVVLVAGLFDVGRINPKRFYKAVDIARQLAPKP